MSRPNTYTNPFSEPYEYPNCRLLFENLLTVLQDSATTSTNQTDNRKLKICAVYAMDIHTRGLSLDGSLMFKTGMLLDRICGKLGIELVFDSFASWECDDLFYLNDALVFEGLAPDFRNDIRTYFPDEESAEEGFKALEDYQNNLYLRAIQSGLQDSNLIVIGSPKVNKVATNLCDIMFANYNHLDNFGMFAYPSRGDSPLLVTQQYVANSTVKQFTINEHDKNHLDFGWLQMIKNPWAESHRFLIQFAGFFQQGTLAANWKLNKILQTIADELDNGKDHNTIKGAARAGNADFRFSLDATIGNAATDESNYRPAHIVRPIYERPKNWFNTTPRYRQRRFPVPPGYEGSILGCEDVIPFSQNTTQIVQS